MKSFSAPALALCLLVVCLGQPALTAEPQAGPAEKRPAVKDLNTPREFPTITSREQWQARAKEIREQVLVSCGLWPIPEKTPLQAQVFGKIEREGYSVEKVHFQPLRGFYLAGNLYRPLGRGKGPFPAILNPHGHWREGRLVDSKDGRDQPTARLLRPCQWESSPAPGMGDFWTFPAPAPLQKHEPA